MKCVRIVHPRWPEAIEPRQIYTSTGERKGRRIDLTTSLASSRPVASWSRLGLVLAHLAAMVLSGELEVAERAPGTSKELHDNRPEPPMVVKTTSVATEVGQGKVRSTSPYSECLATVELEAQIELGAPIELGDFDTFIIHEKHVDESFEIRGDPVKTAEPPYIMFRARGSGAGE